VPKYRRTPVGDLAGGSQPPEAVSVVCYVSEVPPRLLGPFPDRVAHYRIPGPIVAAPVIASTGDGQVHT
jgi:hypothetical protein